MNYNKDVSLCPNTFLVYVMRFSRLNSDAEQLYRYQNIRN